MAANEELNQLSTTDASNTPAGSDVIGATLDNELRSIKANIARSAREESTATASAAATLAVTVLNKIVPVSGSAGGSTTITLPAAATAGAGFRFTAWKTDSTNNVIIDANGAETINGAANYTLATQHEAAQFVTDGTSWIVESTAKRELGSADIADGSITTAKLAASAVTADKLGSDSVTAAKIQASAVGESELASNSVSTAKIQSSAVGESQLATNSVSAAKIQASAVGTSELATDSVTAAKIAAGAVDTSELASDSVTTAKIAASAVTTTELATDSVTAPKIAAGAVGESELASNSVTAAKIAADAVGSSEIASGAVGETELASDSVSSAKIQANAVGASEIASSAVGTSELSNDSATNAKLANMAQDRIKGRVTAGTGDPEDLTASQVRTMLSVYDQSTSDSRYVNVSGDTMTGDLSFGDNDKAIFGTDSDLEIYHSGTHSFIGDVGTGNLYVEGTNLELRATDNSRYLVGTDGGATTLYWAGSNAPRLATTSAGIDVTGTVTSDGATIDGDATVTGRLGDSDGDYGSAGQVLSSTGTGTNWVAAGAYTLPEATSTTRGGIELFSDTDQSVAANAVSSTAGKTYGIQLNSSGQAVVNVPWTDTSYTLPEATSTTRGGIELFSDTDQSVAANAVSSTAGRTYGVQLNSSGQAVVNVPWTDTASGSNIKTQVFNPSGAYNVIITPQIPDGIYQIHFWLEQTSDGNIAIRTSDDNGTNYNDGTSNWSYRGYFYPAGGSITPYASTANLGILDLNGSRGASLNPPEPKTGVATIRRMNLANADWVSVDTNFSAIDSSTYVWGTGRVSCLTSSNSNGIDKIRIFAGAGGTITGRIVIVEYPIS